MRINFRAHVIPDAVQCVCMLLKDVKYISHTREHIILEDFKDMHVEYLSLSLTLLLSHSGYAYGDDTYSVQLSRKYVAAFMPTILLT